MLRLNEFYLKGLFRLEMIDFIEKKCLVYMYVHATIYLLLKTVNATKS